jgi:transposase
MNLLLDIPDNIDALKAALIAARTDLVEVKTYLTAAQTHAVHVESELATAQARVSDDQALIAHLKLQIAKLNRDRFGPRSERTAEEWRRFRTL